MAQIGQKRPNQDADSSTTSDKISKDEAALSSFAKRPAPSTFSFRPSPLQSATKGFALRQSSLKPVGLSSQPSSSLGVSPVSSSTSSDSSEEQSPKVEKSGFLKLNQDGLKMASVANYSITAGERKPVMTTGGASTAATVSLSRNPFSQSDKTPSLGFQSTVGDSSEGNYFAAAKQAQPLVATATDNGVVPGNQQAATPSSSIFLEGSKSSPKSDKDEEEESEQLVFGGPSKQPSLPEVHAFTGEECEKTIVLSSAKLYVFEVDTRTWKDRGRGEIRLNDSAKDEGVFQSRLVMRASGTYRVLLNTHLWSQMSCERANQKSIRITAQHVNSTDNIGVYLITGAAKDIQQLFTAIDRRIQALKRNVPSESKENSSDNSDLPAIPDEEEDKDESLSRQSSPDSSPEAVRVRPMKRPMPVISVSNVDQRSSRNSDSPSDDEGNTETPPPTDDTEIPPPKKKATTSEHIS